MLKRLTPLPVWVYLSLIGNGVLFSVTAFVLRSHEGSVQVNTVPSAPVAEAASLSLGPRHQLTYQQWVALLAQEAKVMAERHPKHLSILVGDSLSLWFPTDLLPTDQVWLNQGISGETSAGLLDRLSLFDETQPEKIFLLIGINDLIRGVSDETLLANQQQIIAHLRQVHPNAQIVVQSVLPHAGNRASWQGRDRLLEVTNDRIRTINQQLADIAHHENVHYLDLHPLFTDSQGNLRPDLSTDGLHLNSQGYLVWRSALQLYTQLELQPRKDKTP